MPTGNITDSARLSAHILVVDDEPANVRLLQRVLQQAGYTAVVSTTDAREVAALCAAQLPDIVLLDLMMPHVDGFAVMTMLEGLKEPGSYLPILVLTADASPDTRRRALSEGATDFLTKPLDHLEVLLRVHNLLETRFLYRRLQGQNQLLEERVQERTKELEEANRGLEASNAKIETSRHELEKSQVEILKRLASAAEFRDDDTGQHTHRVGVMAAALAQRVGVEESRVELIRRTAPLHDVGKIGIPDGILLKPGKLTTEEFEIMKTHTTIGAAMLAEGHSPLVQSAQTIALTHHERWDGAGYPNGLSGEAIPLEGRILSIVDVFDALTNVRPYKEAWPVENALAEIERQSGRQFDPALTSDFISMCSESLPHDDGPA